MMSLPTHPCAYQIIGMAVLALGIYIQVDGSVNNLEQVAHTV